MTTAVAARNVKPRTSPPECECCESPCESGVGEAMERSEDYYRAQPRSMRVAVTSIKNSRQDAGATNPIGDRYSFSKRLFIGMIKP